MSRTAKQPEEQIESADLMVMASVNPLAVFTDREQFSQFYQRMKEETDKHVADVSTDKGRKEVKALAFKVTKAKTTLERAGKDLVEEWRQKTAVVTSARVQMVAELDALAKEVRRPVTEWEAAEEARIERCREVIAGLRNAGVVTMDDTAATVRERGKSVWATEISDDLGDMAEDAKAAKVAAVEALQRALERLTKEEADRAELEVLRASNAEREARDNLRARAEGLIQHCRDCANGTIGGQVQPFGLLLYELESKVAADETLGEFQAEVEAARTQALAAVNKMMEEQAEQRRKDNAEAEAQRIRDAEERAAQAARAEADRVARDAEEQREREHEAALAEQKRRADEAEAREQKRLADEKAAADALREREEDRANRTRVQTAAKVAIMSCGADEDVARKIVLAIIAGEIPRVTLAF